LKKIIKKGIRNIAISVTVIPLATMSLIMAQNAQFVDHIQRWVVNGGLIITIIMFGVFLIHTLKELKKITGKGG